MTAMKTSTHTPPATSLTLSTGGIETTKAILGAMANQRRQQQARQDYGQPVDSNDLGVVHCNRVESLWRTQGRQVLSMHPGLTSEVRMATSAKIVPEVFATLPYRDPLVVFPGGVDIPSWKDGETMRCLGFFTHGRVDHTYQNSGVMVRTPGKSADDCFDEAVTVTSTHDADSEVFSVIIVNLVEGRGMVPMYEYNRIAFPMERPVTLKEIVDQKVANYGWDGYDRGESWKAADDKIVQQAFMRAQLSLVLGSVMYLCSTVLDAEEVPKSRIKRAWGATTRQVPNLINVGWRIGPALTAARAEARQKEASSLPGRSLPPHQRRAHFKTVWTGQGRAVPKTVFIAPYWVRKDLMHLVDTKTVRAVR
jgi:hypothetical protein